MWLDITLLLSGFVVLVLGADWLVNGASALAKKYKVSDLAIGLTIVAFGTSAPELVVNVFAAAQGHHDIVLGNIIGSNNFNLLVILGIAGLITPLVVQSSTVWKEIPFSLLAVAMLYIFANDLFTDGPGVISRIDGIVLLVFFALFLWYVAKQLKSDPHESEVPHKKYSALKMTLLIVGGLAGLVIGGRLVVTSAVEMARVFGMSEKLIGLTIVAAGTSLPELATSVVAALKKNNDIAVGNIIGSNIFNIFLILGLSSVIQPVSFSTVFNTDILLLTFGTLLLFIAMFTGKSHRLDRWEAAILLMMYIGYTVYLVGKG
ncbi:MAG: calcium/sodium antiporter [Paludibacter sp.]|nr:calcium/sodium antiporter [Paludibacter sp.]